MSQNLRQIHIKTYGDMFSDILDPIGKVQECLSALNMMFVDGNAHRLVAAAKLTHVQADITASLALIKARGKRKPTLEPE